MAQTKKATKGLGRGFEALIPKDFDNSLLLAEHERIQKLPLKQLAANKSQPRQQFDQQALQELAQSIKRYGILQPLVVTPVGSDNYRIIAGERRWRAAELAGLQSVPAIVRTSKELEELEIALIENVQRVDLSPLEQAVSIQRLHEQFNLDYASIASRLGKAISSVNNIVRLLQLPEAAQQALQTGKITEGHARAILALKPQPDKQQELLDLIIRQKWSVRQAEQFVTAIKKGAPTSKEARQQIKATNPQTRKLGNIIKAPVKIHYTAKGGKLELGFGSEAELQQLLNLLIQKLQ